MSHGIQGRDARLVLIRDVTEQVQAERVLEAHRAQLTEKVEEGHRLQKGSMLPPWQAS